MPSRVIRGFAYDPAARSLDLLFVSGRRYRYHEVPVEVAEGLAAAFAKGPFFNRRIRHRYAFEELQPDEDV